MKQDEIYNCIISVTNMVADNCKKDLTPAVLISVKQVNDSTTIGTNIFVKPDMVTIELLEGIELLIDKAKNNIRTRIELLKQGANHG